MYTEHLPHGCLPGHSGTPIAAIAQHTQQPGVTQLLAAASDGDSSAWHRIYALLYKDLHQIARSQIRRRSALQVSPTSLISEAWLKLSGAKLDIEGGRHLTALIARAMRFVLLDETRRILADKRRVAEGTVQSQEDPVDAVADGRLEQLLVLGQALEDLSCMDERLTQVVEMRYFGGLSEQEIATHLQLNVRTIRRDWRRARAFLLNRLGGTSHGILI